MVSLMQRRREMMRLASVGPTPTPSINDYVHDGVRFWLDGIENTRSGHNASAAKWEDLSPNQLDFSYNSSSVIGDTYCIPNGKMAGTNILGTTTSYTIEIVVEYISSGNSQMILPWRQNAYGTVWIGNGSPGILYFSAGNNNGCKGVQMPSGIVTYTARGLNSICANGVSQTIVTNSSTWGTKYNQIGYYSSSYPRNCTSKIYAIRIHNRHLTDAEVAENCRIDAARFK